MALNTEIAPLGASKLCNFTAKGVRSSQNDKTNESTNIEGNMNREIPKVIQLAIKTERVYITRLPQPHIW